VKGQYPAEIGVARERLLGARTVAEGTGATVIDLMARDRDACSSRQGASMISIVAASSKINTSARGACAEVFA
jgi:hypothetical protein